MVVGALDEDLDELLEGDDCRVEDGVAQKECRFDCCPAELLIGNDDTGSCDGNADAGRQSG